MKRSLIAASAIASLIMGCSDNTVTEPTVTPENFDNITVSSSWVKEHLTDTNIVIIDARVDSASFDLGHIPGAQWAGWDAFVDPVSMDFLPAAELGNKIASYGITKSKTVVVYADNKTDPSGYDARIAWTMHVAGVQAKMVNGGITSWKKANYEVETSSTKHNSSAFALSKIDSSNIVTYSVVQEAAAGTKPAKILDVRTDAEFNAGKIGNAEHIWVSDLLTAEGALKDPKDIISMLDAHNIGKSDLIYTYCLGGYRAAYMTLVLQTLGYSNAKVYDGSWAEWSQKTKKVK